MTEVYDTDRSKVKGRGEAMPFPIVVESTDGQFSARLLGDKSVCVVRPTRHEAVDAIAREIERRVQDGELVSIDIPKPGAAAMIGLGADDPTWPELVREIYAERDRERDELPE